MVYDSATELVDSPVTHVKETAENKLSKYVFCEVAAVLIGKLNNNEPIKMTKAKLKAIRVDIDSFLNLSNNIKATSFSKTLDTQMYYRPIT